CARLRREDDRPTGVLLEVGSTDAAPQGTQQDVVGPGTVGRRHLLHPDGLGRVEHCCLHECGLPSMVGSNSTLPSRPPEASRSRWVGTSLSGRTEASSSDATSVVARMSRAGPRSSPQTWAKVVSTEISFIPIRWRVTG